MNDLAETIINLNNRKMKKLIDLNESTKLILSIDAARKQTNLKSYIENMLMERAEKLKETIKIK